MCRSPLFSIVYLDASKETQAELKRCEDKQTAVDVLYENDDRLWTKSFVYLAIELKIPFLHNYDSKVFDEHETSTKS